MFDLIIKNGLIVDGSGADAYSADIGIIDDKIEKIGNLKDEKATQVIDAAGKVVTPGFMDSHSHGDLGVLTNPNMEAYLMQGVTTLVGGNCGHAMAPVSDEFYRSAIVDFDVVLEAQPSYFQMSTILLPKEPAKQALKKLYDVDLDWKSFGEYIDKCNKKGLDCNIASLAGYSAIRGAVMGMDSMREATSDELNRLEELVETCMKEGAFGLSTGLDPQYIPGLFATDEETIRMLEITKKYDGIFTSHTFNVDKDGTPGRMAGYVKMLEQAKAAGIRANVSHVHVLGMGATPEAGAQAARDTLAYFEKMEAEGLDLSYDVIPSPYSTDYTIPYFSFFLRPFILMSGSRKQLAKNFTVPDFRQMVREVIKGGMYPVFDPSQPMNYFALLTIDKHVNKEHVGKNIAAYGAEKGVDPLDLVMELFAEDPDMSANIGMAAFAEANDILCGHRMAMPCSDGMACSKDTNFTKNEEMPLYPNAMNISFIPRYILQHGKPRFEDTIKQISGNVAERFGIAERGFLKEGYYADVVVLDRQALYSYDMYENPLQYPEGFAHVIVNGKPAVENKRYLGAVSGKMLRKR